MKKIMLLLFLFSLLILSCSQNVDLYNIVIQNNASSSVSGTISMDNEDDKSFTVSAGSSDKIEVSGIYAVSYQNKYGRIAGSIDYFSNTVIFADNPGLSLILKNETPEDAYVFTGGYIESELPTAGKYKVDGTEGFKVDASATDSSKKIYTPIPVFVVKTIDGISAEITWAISDAVPPVMTCVIHY